MAELLEGACCGIPDFRCPVFGDLAGAEALGRNRLWTKHDFADLPDVPGDGPFRADFLAPVSSADGKGPWVGFVVDRCEYGVDVCAALGMEADAFPDMKILATFTESGFLDAESVGNDLKEAAASW